MECLTLVFQLLLYYGADIISSESKLLLIDVSLLLFHTFALQI